MSTKRSQRLLLLFAILQIFCFIVSSCSRSKEIESKIEKMSDSPVNLDIQEMTVWRPANAESTFSNNTSKYKMVIFVDSTQCSGCFISSLPEWDELLQIEKDPAYDVTFYFIIAPPDGNEDVLIDNLEMSKFKHPVLIDRKSKFYCLNPHIPQEALYHCFLLNHTNNVILVGNPLNNERIRTLFYKKLKKNNK